MYYVIGKPNETPRMTINVMGQASPSEIESQLLPGEIFGEFEFLPEGTLQLNADKTISIVNDKVEDARNIKLSHLKALRNDAQASGVVTPYGHVDTDLFSMTKLNAAASAAHAAKASGGEFSINWTMHDQEPSVIDADKLIEIISLVFAHFNHCQETYTTNKAIIMAAQSIDAIEAIDLMTINWDN